VRTIGGLCQILFNRFHANQGVRVVEAQQVPVEYAGQLRPIVIRVISREKRVAEALLFCAPSFLLSPSRRLPSQPSAPCNAKYNRGVSHVVAMFLRRRAVITAEW
jgi:hypothetical protein